MSNFSTNLLDYILSGHSILSIQTHEKDRCTQEIKALARQEGMGYYEWSISKGWQDIDHNKKSDQTPPEIVTDFIIAANEEKAIFILKDFNLYLNIEKFSSADIIVSSLYEIKDLLSNMQKTIILIGANNFIPEELKHSVAYIDFSLPDENSIENGVRFVVESIDNKEFEFDETCLPDIINACKGLTQTEVIDRVALAVRKHKLLSRPAINTILNEKAAVIKASGILQYIEPPPGGLNIVGGYDLLKEYIKTDAPCFSKEATSFGIEFPKGLLFVGVPGAGKTLISTAIASEFGFPLIRMDINNLMNKYVGESESNMKTAIQVLETISPCVLLLDEIEKGFSGAGSDDSGPLRRMFGMFLGWLNDRIAPVYVVATANQISSLPPEFLRTGRFDAIFGLDLPNEKERKDIVLIHLQKRKRALDEKQLSHLVKQSENFTGSDIEQFIKLGLKLSFVHKKDLFECLLSAVAQIIPLIKTEPEKIDAIRNWCKLRAKPSSKIENKQDNKQRRVEL